MRSCEYLKVAALSTPQLHEKIVLSVYRSAIGFQRSSGENRRRALEKFPRAEKHAMIEYFRSVVDCKAYPTRIAIAASPEIRIEKDATVERALVPEG
jgi:hypothetical protein